jgi:hypothetical protein
MTPEQHREPGTLCPDWCVVDHSRAHREDDHIHIGVDEALANGITVRLVACHDPDTGSMVGPYMLVDAPQFALDPYELDLREARTIGEALISLADRGEHRATVLSLPAQRLPGSRS